MATKLDKIEHIIRLRENYEYIRNKPIHMLNAEESAKYNSLAIYLLDEIKFCLNVDQNTFERKILFEKIIDNSKNRIILH